MARARGVQDTRRASDWSCTRGWLRRRPVVDGADGEGPDDRGGAVLPAPAPVQGVVAGRACVPQRALRVVSPVGTASVHETVWRSAAPAAASRQLQSAAVLVGSTTGWSADGPARILQAGPLKLVLVQPGRLAPEVAAGFGLR